jgi:hypothetical protein
MRRSRPRSTWLTTWSRERPLTDPLADKDGAPRALGFPRNEKAGAKVAFRGGILGQPGRSVEEQSDINKKERSPMPPRKRDCTPVKIILTVGAVLMILVVASLLAR